MADNVEILRQPMFKTPMYMGDFDPDRQSGYNVMNQVSLFGCVWESKSDNNTTAPAVWDGGETITPNTINWKQVSGDYEAWLMKLDKPAQSEAYPFNGMGYVVLKKNIQEVGGVEKNLLTQDMFYKDGPSNTRVPNTNTIFEIKYDYELAENITIPAGCVLKFEGGSISGTHTLTGQNTGIQAGLVKIIDSDVTLAGTWDISEAYPEWFGAKGDYTRDDAAEINKCINTFKTCYLTGVYLVGRTILLTTGNTLIGKHSNTFLISRTNISIITIAEGSRYVTIKNLTIRNDITTNDNTDDIGIRINERVNNSVFSDIKIIQCYYGIHIRSGFWQNTIKNIRIDKPVYGIYFDQSIASICNVMENVYIGEFTKTAIFAYNVSGLLITNLNLDCTNATEAPLYFINGRVFINRFNVESFKGDVAIFLYNQAVVSLSNGGFNDCEMSGSSRCLILLENSCKLYLDNVIKGDDVTNVYYDIINIGSSVTYVKEPSELTIRGNAFRIPTNKYGNTRPTLTSDDMYKGTRFFDTTLGKPIYFNGTYWVDGNGYSAAPNRGDTNSRPKGTVAGGVLQAGVDIGFCYFDTDINKPIYVKNILGNGVVVWVDALGNDVTTSYITKNGTLVGGNVPEFDGTDGAVKDSGKAATSIP